MKKNKNTAPLFTDAEKLKEKAECYFRSCAGVQAKDEYGEPVYDKNGVPVMSVPESPFTISGLAAALGFRNRRELLNYEEVCSEKCADVIARALSRIEEYAESKLFDKGQYSGAKFFLASSFGGWCEKPDDSAAETLEKLDAVLRALTEAMNR